MIKLFGRMLVTQKEWVEQTDTAWNNGFKEGVEQNAVTQMALDAVKQAEYNRGKVDGQRIAVAAATKALKEGANNGTKTNK